MGEQADFIFYMLRPVSKLQAKSAVEKAAESAICVRLADNYALLTRSQLQAMLLACERSK